MLVRQAPGYLHIYLSMKIDNKNAQKKNKCAALDQYVIAYMQYFW